MKTKKSVVNHLLSSLLKWITGVCFGWAAAIKYTSILPHAVEFLVLITVLVCLAFTLTLVIDTGE